MTATAADLHTSPDARYTALPPRLTRAGIDGLLSAVRVTGTETVATRAPYTGDVIADLPQCTAADVDAAFGRARSAQRSWADRPVRERTAVFLRLHDLILDRQDEIMDLIQLENGKSRRDAFLEVADIANTARYYARTARSLLRPRSRTGLFPGLTST